MSRSGTRKVLHQLYLRRQCEVANYLDIENQRQIVHHRCMYACQQSTNSNVRRLVYVLPTKPMRKATGRKIKAEKDNYKGGWVKRSRKLSKVRTACDVKLYYLTTQAVAICLVF